MVSVAVALTRGSPAVAQQAKRFSLEASVQSTYEDNVARSNAIAAAARGIEQEDVRFSPAISVDIVQPFGRQAAFLIGSVGYEFWDKNDQFNRERVSLNGGAISQFRICQTTLAGEYRRGQSDLRDLELTGVVENAETKTGVSGAVTCGRTVGFGATASIGQQWAENSAAARQTSNYDTTNTSIGLLYRRPTFGEATLYASYGKTEYSDRLIVTTSGLETDGFENFGGGLRYTRKLGARLQGTVGAGYSVVRPTTSNATDFEGITYLADLTYRPSSRIQAQFTFERATRPSNRLQTTYAVEDSYLVDVSYALGSRIRLGLGASYADSNYEGSNLTGINSITDQQIKRVFASVRFNLNERISALLEAGQEERDANVHGVDFTANRLGFTLVGRY